MNTQVNPNALVKANYAQYLAGVKACYETQANWRKGPPKRLKGNERVAWNYGWNSQASVLRPGCML